MADYTSQVTRWWEVLRAASGFCFLGKTISGANTHDLHLGLCQAPWHCSGCLPQNSHSPILLFPVELMLLDYRFPWMKWHISSPTCQLPYWIPQGRLSYQGKLQRVSCWWHYCLTLHFGLLPGCGGGVLSLASHYQFVIDQSLPFSCPMETVNFIWYLFLKLGLFLVQVTPPHTRSVKRHRPWWSKLP